MKIIGFTYLDGQAEMMLRCDSCLLNGGKPFFMPEEGADMRATRCIVLRVSRLGKGIQAKFANRYYDAWAPGLDIIDHARLAEARANSHSWTEAIAADYSLPLGEWTESQPLPDAPYCLSAAEAIERISRVMTIRQGDLIYIDYAEEATPLVREQVITGPQGQEDKLYCKIK